MMQPLQNQPTELSLLTSMITTTLTQTLTAMHDIGQLSFGKLRKGADYTRAIALEILNFRDNPNLENDRVRQKSKEYRFESSVSGKSVRLPFTINLTKVTGGIIEVEIHHGLKIKSNKLMKTKSGEVLTISPDSSVAAKTRPIEIQRSLILDEEAHEKIEFPADLVQRLPDTNFMVVPKVRWYLDKSGNPRVECIQERYPTSFLEVIGTNRVNLKTEDSTSSREVSEGERLDILQDVADSLKRMHALGLVHCYPTAKNIKVKIADNRPRGLLSNFWLSRDISVSIGSEKFSSRRDLSYIEGFITPQTDIYTFVVSTVGEAVLPNFYSHADKLRGTDENSLNVAFIMSLRDQLAIDCARLGLQDVSLKDFTGALLVKRPVDPVTTHDKLIRLLTSQEEKTINFFQTTYAIRPVNQSILSSRLKAFFEEQKSEAKEWLVDFNASIAKDPLPTMNPWDPQDIVVALFRKVHKEITEQLHGDLVDLEIEDGFEKKYIIFKPSEVDTIIESFSSGLETLFGKNPDEIMAQVSRFLQQVVPFSELNQLERRYQARLQVFELIKETIQRSEALHQHLAKVFEENGNARLQDELDKIVGDSTLCVSIEAIGERLRQIRTAF